MDFPTKQMKIGERSYTIAGVRDDDPYFTAMSGDTDAEFDSLCRSLVGEDYNCLDIGANIGLKSLLLSQIACRGTILAVEAGRTVSEVLRINVMASGAENISVANCAVAGADGEVNFEENSAYGHIGGAGVTTPAKRIETLLSEHGITRLDFVKIDVEGFEFDILKDALAVIDHHRALVLFEFNAWCLMVFARVPPLDFAEWILASFAHVYLLRRAGGLLKLGRDDGRKLLSTNLIQDGLVSDILATNAPERLLGLSIAKDREIASLQAALSETSAELTAAEARRQALIEELRRLEAARDAAVGQALEKTSELEAIGREARRLAAERDEALERLRAIEGSRSWRMTAALRSVRRRL